MDEAELHDAIAEAEKTAGLAWETVWTCEERLAMLRAARDLMSPPDDA
jgi:hypothetical protein